MNYVQNFIDEGYKYMIMPTRKKKTFYATKAVMKKDGSFRGNANFDEYVLEDSETWPFDKGVYIKL